MNQTGLRVGQRFKAVVESVELDMPILGIIRDYRTRGACCLLLLSFFERAQQTVGMDGRDYIYK